MATGDIFVDIKNNRILGTSDLRDNFLEYLVGQLTHQMSHIFDSDGAFAAKHVISGDGADKFQLSGDHCTDGDGHILHPAGLTGIQFENTLAVLYYVALKYCEKPVGIQINPETGDPEYISGQEAVGERAEPDLVTDNGNGTITLRVNSVTEAGVSNAGRQVMVFRKVPAKNAINVSVAIETRTVVFSGGHNVITTTGALGQPSISTDAADYEVILLGPTVKRNTDLSSASGYFFVGTVTGAGAGNAPVTFNTTDQNLFTTTLGNISDVTRIDSHGDLKIEVQADASDSGEPQITVRNSGGSVVFSVDEAGNMTVAGTQTVNNVQTINSSSTITDNLTAGNASGDNHKVRGTWTHRDGADAATYFVVNGSNGRVGIGGAEGSTALRITGDTQSVGHIAPSADNTYDIGSLTERWRTAYLQMINVPSLQLEGTTPALLIYETDAPLDEKRWRVSANAGQMAIRAYNDADASPYDVALVNRTGTTITTLQLNTNLVPAQNAVFDLGVQTTALWAGVYSAYNEVDLDSSDSNVIAKWRDHAGAANAKNWQWFFDASQAGHLSLQSGTDAGTYTVAMEFTRAAGLVTAITMRGDLLPLTSAAYDLGSASRRYVEAYFDTLFATTFTEETANVVQRLSTNGADLKNWRWNIASPSGALSLQSGTDASSYTSALTVNRSAGVASSIEVTTTFRPTADGTLALGASAQRWASLFLAGFFQSEGAGASWEMYWNNTTPISTDERRWKWYFSSPNLKFAAVSNAGAVTDLLEWVRSGADATSLRVSSNLTLDSDGGVSNQNLWSWRMGTSTLQFTADNDADSTHSVVYEVGRTTTSVNYFRVNTTLQPFNDNTIGAGDLGAAGQRWRDLYVGNEIKWDGHLAQSHRNADSDVTVTGAFTDIPFGTDVYLIGVSKPASDNFQVSRTGKYRISYVVQFTGTTSSSEGFCAAHVRINDTTIIPTSEHSVYGPDPTGVTNTFSVSITTTFIVSLTAGDFVTLRAIFIAGGGGAAVRGTNTPGTGGGSTIFSIEEMPHN